MRNRRFAAIVLAVAMAAMTIAATSASARPQHAGAAGANKAARRRNLPDGVGVVVRLHRQLRPDR